MSEPCFCHPKSPTMCSMCALDKVNQAKIEGARLALEAAAEITNEEVIRNRERAAVHKSEMRMQDIVAADTASDILENIKALSPSALVVESNKGKG